MDYSALPELPEGAKHISEREEYRHLFGYAALPDGTIITCKPPVSTKGITYSNNWREKKIYIAKSGYALLKTKNATKRKTSSDSVHRIIGALFLPNPNSFPVINHKNGIKHDNKVGNLEWCTQQQNAIHCIENNLRDTAKGESIPNAVLTDKNILDIFTMKASGRLNREIADKFNVEASVISRILARKRWAHVNIPDHLLVAAKEVYTKIKTTPRGNKLSEADVIKIRELRKSGKMVKEIASQFGIHPGVCGEIINYRYWKNIR